VDGGGARLWAGSRAQSPNRRDALEASRAATRPGPHLDRERQRPGQAARHRDPPTAHLLPRHTTSQLNIRVTSPARTLADLRRGGPDWEYRKALRQAEFRQLPIGDLPEADGTRSGLEASFLRFCRRHRLPEPEPNAKLGPFTVDFLWRAQRVVVETDSYRTHGGVLAFEEDRERDMWLKVNGYEVVRITDRQLETDPARVAASLRAILARAAVA
jgi:very-short-patch-repair endonuclease